MESVVAPNRVDIQPPPTPKRAAKSKMKGGAPMSPLTPYGNLDYEETRGSDVAATMPVSPHKDSLSVRTVREHALGDGDTRMPALPLSRATPRQIRKSRVSHPSSDAADPMAPTLAMQEVHSPREINDSTAPTPELQSAEKAIVKKRRNRRRKKSTSTNIDGFEVLNKIGEGGFGTVLLARKKDNGKLYALKVRTLGLRLGFGFGLGLPHHAAGPTVRRTLTRCPSSSLIECKFEPSRHAPYLTQYLTSARLPSLTSKVLVKKSMKIQDAERAIGESVAMQELQHPFVVELFFAFQVSMADDSIFATPTPWPR